MRLLKLPHKYIRRIPQYAIMFGFIAGQGAPLYSSNLVDLVINFIFDGKDLLAKEHSEEIQKQQYGYAGYLRVESRRGVHNPLVLAYMNKYFHQFRGVVELCSALETTMKRHDEKWWQFLQGAGSLSGRRDYVDLYLCRFIPDPELIRAIKSL